MAEKVMQLGLERDHKNFLYYVDGEGRVCRKPKSGGEPEVIVEGRVNREKNFLYYLDKDGDVARSPMARKAKA